MKTANPKTAQTTTGGNTKTNKPLRSKGLPDMPRPAKLIGLGGALIDGAEGGTFKPLALVEYTDGVQRVITPLTVQAATHKRFHALPKVQQDQLLKHARTSRAVAVLNCQELARSQGTIQVRPRW